MRSTTTGSSTQTVAVIGLGKIGLPLAAQFAARGKKVLGCDVLPDVVETINGGHSHIHEEAGLDAVIASAVQNGNLTATTDTTAAVEKSQVVVVIVPVIVDSNKTIDYRGIDAATRAIGRGLKRGALVIYETTLPVGTTRRRFGPMLEHESGLVAGTDFRLAFSPERLYVGRIFQDLKNYPKIVGGIDAESTDSAVDFYRSVLDADVWPMDNAETAEFAKLAETTYRDVNIALANELALYGGSREVNVSQAFKAANSQPYSHIHRPSIGVGGHCIPVYPHFLLHDAGEGELSLVRDSRRANDGMAQVAVDALDHAVGGLDSKTVLVLGAAYRENVKELAFSTALRLVGQLAAAGARVLIADPLFTDRELAHLQAKPVAFDSETAADADAVVVQAWHDEFRNVDWKRFGRLQAVLDGRGVLDPSEIREAGATYLAFGSAL